MPIPTPAARRVVAVLRRARSDLGLLRNRRGAGACAARSRRSRGRGVRGEGRAAGRLGRGRAAGGGGAAGAAAGGCGVSSRVNIGGGSGCSAAGCSSWPANQSSEKTCNSSTSARSASRRRQCPRAQACAASHGWARAASRRTSRQVVTAAGRFNSSRNRRRSRATSAVIFLWLPAYSSRSSSLVRRQPVPATSTPSHSSLAASPPVRPRRRAARS